MQNRVSYLIIGFICVLGLIFVFLVPPFQKPDENRHYLQASALSFGQFRCRTNSEGTPSLSLPASVIAFPDALKYSEIAHTPDFKFSRQLLGLYPYPTTPEPMQDYGDWCASPFLGYLPHALALLLTRYSGSMMIEFYFARLLVFALFLATLIYCLKTIDQSGKRWLLLYSATFMTIHQVTAISYDAPILILNLVVFTALYNHIFGHAHSRGKAQAYLGALALGLMIIIKVTYLPLALLAGLILSSWRKIGIFLILLLSCIFAFVRNAHFSDISRYVDPARQLSYVLSDPLQFIQAIITTISLDTYPILAGLVGEFGWLDYRLPGFIYFGYLLLFAWLVFTSPKLKQVSLRTTLTLALTIVLSIIAIFGTMYLIWTPLGMTTISGVQGRYFLPLLPYLGVTLAYLYQVVLSRKNIHFWLTLIMMLILVAILAFHVYRRYYDYSNYGINDRESPAHPTVAQLHQLEPQYFTLPGNSVKLAGFYFYPDTLPKDIIYRYHLKDQSCSNTITAGYLQNIHAYHTGVYLEYFKPFWVDSSDLCFVLENHEGSQLSLDLYPFQDGTFVKPLYLIPSIK